MTTTPIAQKRLLLDIMKREALVIHFQPIFDTFNQRVLGFEALTRVPSTPYFSTPTKLFELAYQCHLLSELELLCRKLAIKKFAALQLSGQLFLNVSPLTLTYANHPKGETLRYVKECGLSARQIVIEITERFDANDHNHLKQTLEYYRELGFKIAIDDLGTGHSGLKQWAEFLPDIVKIDRYFISECHVNIVKRELLKTIFALGEATNVRIVAEGIEKEEEYFQLKRLGMRYAQGYLLAKPSNMPAINIPAILMRNRASEIIQPSLHSRKSA